MKRNVPSTLVILTLIGASAGFAQPTINLGPITGTIPGQPPQATGGSRQTVDFGPFDIPGPGRITFEVFSTPDVRGDMPLTERHESTVQTIDFNGEEISLRSDFPICNDPGSDPAICVSIWDPPSAGTMNFELLGPAVFTSGGFFAGHDAQDYTINVFYQRGPLVSEVLPDTGSTQGRRPVSVMGTDFAENAIVLFGGTAATDTLRISDTEIQCTIPPGVPGATDVIVLHPDPEEAPWNFGRPWGIFGVLPGGFTYETPQPPPVLQAERLLGTYSGFFEEQRHIQVDRNSARQASDFPFTIPGAGRLRWEAWAFIPITGPVNGPEGDRLNFEAFNDSTAVRRYTRGDGLGASTNVRCTSLTYEYGPVICNSTSIVDVTGSGAGEFRVLGPERTSALFGDFISAPFQDWTLALWFADQPVVTDIQPGFGPTQGGTSLTIAGTDFAEGARVFFGDNEASGVTVQDPNTIFCEAPPGESGFVDVSVAIFTSLRGTLEAGFEYGGGPTPTFDFDQVNDDRIDSEDLLAVIVLIIDTGDGIDLDPLVLFDFSRFWMDVFP